MRRGRGEGGWHLKLITSQWECRGPATSGGLRALLCHGGSPPEPLHLWGFIHVHPLPHLPAQLSHAVANTVEWQCGNIPQTQPHLSVQAGPVASMSITTTPQGSCDSWTLDPNEGLGCTQPWCPRGQLTRGPLVGRGMYSSVEPSPRPCTVSPTPFPGAARWTVITPCVALDSSRPLLSQTEAWSSSSPSCSSPHPRGFAQLHNHLP